MAMACNRRFVLYSGVQQADRSQHLGSLSPPLETSFVGCVRQPLTVISANFYKLSLCIMHQKQCGGVAQFAFRSSRAGQKDGVSIFVSQASTPRVAVKIPTVVATRKTDTLLFCSSSSVIFERSLADADMPCGGMQTANHRRTSDVKALTWNNDVGQEIRCVLP